ncbi:MAG: bifunctional diaminohydroxyphosphoribosylaminopyrimidine deaminase/5-amino-6-(5-phosphoribosylamino)uracil reductase RibD [Actinomycetota bacterium]|nr:bifunctional diaminohydroxyphosphoribosylaminopyrimidine deaminase/5-amino-6-(5-phosphoribosylamino)uracil reductase RibD [Actinomycetota bacterium]
MQHAIELAWSVRTTTAPNPWVGAALLANDGTVHVGATQPPGGAHAEIGVLTAAGSDAVGATLAITLEPCCHTGRTGPCTTAIIEAGVVRVLIGIKDPDEQVAGGGITALQDAGIEVVVGTLSAEVRAQLEPYLHHRRTGRPYVILKLAATLDGRTAAPDGDSKWVTSEEARTDVHQMRAESQAILVGAGTVRADNPSLNVRLVDGPSPRRIVLGAAPADANIHPCTEWVGPIPELLDRLGTEGVLQLMVEGGANVASEFHDASLVDRYVLYVAPAIFGGNDAHPLFVGDGAPTMADLRRGRFVATRRLGNDIRLDVMLDKDVPSSPSGAPPGPDATAQ